MADESTQRTVALRVPMDPGGNSPCASVNLGVDALPCVGIVWGVPDGRGPLRLISDRTLLAAAETYGDHLTHPRGHHEVWEGWRRLGPAGLARPGRPPRRAGPACWARAGAGPGVPPRTRAFSSCGRPGCRPPGPPAS